MCFLSSSDSPYAKIKLLTFSPIKDKESLRVSLVLTGLTNFAYVKN